MRRYRLREVGWRAQGIDIEVEQRNSSRIRAKPWHQFDLERRPHVHRSCIKSPHTKMSTSLDAAAAQRKERLAQLKSLKRKQDEAADRNDSEDAGESTVSEVSASIGKVKLSGRNYDVEAGVPKTGFLEPPSAKQETVEDRAARLAEEAKKQAEEAEKQSAQIDLFSLQPKKPNWDLKRDVEKKMERLDARTEIAIAKIVRERIKAAKAKAESDGNKGEMEAAGIEGNLADLVKEREKENDAERDAEDESD